MKIFNYKKRIFAVASILGITILFILLGNRFLFNTADHDYLRLTGYALEEDNTVDVVIMGSSEVFCDYSPGKAFEESKITSYPFAFNRNPSTLWKFELDEIQRNQKPKLLVVEINGASYPEEEMYDYGAARRLIDSMPISKNKVRTINELAPLIGDEDKLGYYLPIIKFHGKVLQHHPLSSLVPYLRGYNLLRGEFIHTGSLGESKEETDELVFDKKAVLPLAPSGEKSLKEFLEECRDLEIENVLFVRFPHTPIKEFSRKSTMKYNYAREIIESYGFQYLNLDDYVEEMGIIRDEDFHDGEHLNGRGKQKFTKWFINFLADKYELKPTELTDSQRAEWENTVNYTNRLYRYYEKYVHDNPDSDLREPITETIQTVKDLEKQE